MTEEQISAAARSWLDVSGERLDHERIELLSGARDTIVCRLDSASGIIIAKWDSEDIISLERTIYETMLADSGLSALRCHGTSGCDEHGRAWLFVDDAAGSAYDPRDPAHRAIAAEWLARLHTSVARRMDDCKLPPKQPVQYRQLLRNARKTLSSLAAIDAISDDQRIIVDDVLKHCRSLVDNWSAIERACANTYEALVHGDIVTHNARIRETPAGPEFILFDWEKSGWGTPAEDVSDIDLDAYRKTARDCGLDISASTLRQLAGAGKSFRCLVFLQWLAPELLTHSAEAYEQLDLCRTWLDTINAERPWQS